MRLCGVLRGLPYPANFLEQTFNQSRHGEHQNVLIAHMCYDMGVALPTPLGTRMST